MSSYAKLIINEIAADSFSLEKTPLNLKQRISNPDGQPAGSFTRSTITIPATKNNKSILEGELGFLPFRIEINGATRLNGFLQVKKKGITSNCYGCTVDSYQVSLQGGNSDWFLELRQSRLSDLTNETILFNEAEIENGFNADPLATNSGFFFMKFREWENARTVTENDPFGGTYQRELESPSFFEATPFLYIYPLIETAFNNVGYTIESNFLSSDFFRRLIMPVPLPDKMPEEYSENYINFYGSLETQNYPISPLTVNDKIGYNDTILPPKNIGVWDPILFEYEVPETGFYEIEIQGQAGPEIFNGNFLAINYIVKNNAIIEIGAGFSIGEVFNPVPIPFPTNEIKNFKDVYQLNKGDIISVYYYYYSDNPFSIVNNFVRITGEANRQEGLNIDFSSLLNKYEFLPLLKDITTIFKLGFDTDPDTKKVIIEPLDPYLYSDRIANIKESREGYYFINDSIDYSRKIDFKNPIENTINSMEGQFNFSYLSDDDPTISYREQNERFKIYEAIFNSPNGSDRNKTKKIETEFFAKSVHVSDNYTRYPNTQINPQFVLSYPFNYVLNPTATAQDVNFDISPRLLYFGGQRDGIDGFIEIFENPNIPIELPAAFMVNYNDVSGLDPNLSFSNENIGQNVVSGILQRFHINCLARLSQREQKTSSVLTNSIERDNFSFRNKALISGKRYIIESVESVNPLQSTPDKFLFILDEFASQETINNILNSNLNGLFTIFP